MELDQGQHYTREQIRDAVGGGDLQSYLPHKGGRVLCGCFSLDLNKRAPVEIDVGDLPDVIKYAHALVDQGGVIPIFLKKGIHAWEYVGRFRPVALSEDPADLYPARARRPDAVAVIYLESVEESDSNPLGIAEIAALEGRQILVEHLRRERSRSLAAAKRRLVHDQQGVLVCEACHLSEATLPRQFAEACFEVHHLTPVSQLTEPSITRLEDLAVLCANCHRMIHRSDPMESVPDFAMLLASPTRKGS